ncbi:MAG: SusD/RagB family nutrient-binding outer membrane lipoprotein [Gemmatimonadota bacterium]
MRKSLMLAGALSLAATAAACTSFLTDPTAATDPNNPATVTTAQLFTAVQAGQFIAQEGNMAFITCLFMQQCQGVGGRFVSKESQYTITNATANGEFAGVFGAGGLLDIKTIEARSDAAGDLQFKGIAEVWEALTIGTGADVFGDIPYREAAGDAAHPQYDPQLQVYDDIEAKLDQAITDLAGAGPGPGANDFVYGGDVAKWTAAAHTLKARYYLHQVEAVGATKYQDAITAATSGIATHAGDFNTFHTTATFERNVWYQFQVNSGFGDDIVAGATLVNIMNAQNDPRRAQYFGKTPSGLYGGVDVNGAVSPNGVSGLKGLRDDPGFRQPVVTSDENSLILAEANFALHGAAAAQPFLDQERTSNGLTPLVATLQSIMTEKYVALFQNIEVWSDYKRTCLPALTPFSSPTFGNAIPGRLYYGAAEENTNPNTPTAAEQLQHGGDVVSGVGIVGFRNPNDPNPCTGS